MLVLPHRHRGKPRRHENADNPIADRLKVKPSKPAPERALKIQLPRQHLQKLNTANNKRDKDRDDRNGQIIVDLPERLHKSPTVRHTHSHTVSRIDKYHSQSKHHRQYQNHPDRNRRSNPKTHSESKEKNLTRSVKPQAEEHADRVNLPWPLDYPEEPLEVPVEKSTILQQIIQLRLVNTSPSKILEHAVDTSHDQSVHSSNQEQEQSGHGGSDNRSRSLQKRTILDNNPGCKNKPHCEPHYDG